MRSATACKATALKKDGYEFSRKASYENLIDLQQDWQQCTIGHSTRIYANVEIGDNCSIGDFCVIGHLVRAKMPAGSRDGCNCTLACCVV